MIEKCRLLDYLDSRGRNVMQAWADRLGLNQKMRGRLDAKIDMLASIGDGLSPELLQNTKSKHIMEMAVNSRQLALRPMLCRGPFDMQGEFTFLFGAIEKNRKYIPSDAPARANANRDDLLVNPGKRCEHERFN